MLQQEISAVDAAPVANINGQHIEMFCTFTTGGTAVNVVSPEFVLRTNSSGGTVVTIPSGSLLVPFSRNGPGAGRYHTCFLAGDWLSDGDYWVSLSGKYPDVSGSTLSYTGTFSARTAPTVQTYIEMLRSKLHDYLPRLYRVESATDYLWTDGQLYDALIEATNAINAVPPSRYTFSIETVPWPNLLLDGGMIYALHAKMLLEVVNTFNYNDEISFSIDRASKYQSAAQFFYGNWIQMLVRTKRDYAFSRAQPIGMGQTRIPYSLARIFSFSPYMMNTFASQWT